MVRFIRETFDRPVVGVMSLGEVVARRKGAMGGAVMPITRAGKRYADGKDYANQLAYMTLSDSNCWSGPTNNGGWCSSYECIGYHSGSVDFLAGALDAGCAVYAHCEDGWRVVTNE